MYRNEIPVFGKGSILKREMLENLRDFPRDFTDIYFGEHSDGIISGCLLKVKENKIVVKSGIIKYRERLYFFNGEEEIVYENFSHEVVLKIRFFQDESDKSFLKYGTKLFLDSDTELKDGEMELGRFKLKEGAKLRENYVDFADMSTEYNTFNIINVSYSGNGCETVHPAIIKKFAESLIKSSTKEPEDIIFAMLGLNSKVIERSVITEYIARKSGIENRKMTNGEIYKNLLKILRNMKDGKRAAEPVNRNRPNVIIVD